MTTLTAVPPGAALDLSDGAAVHADTVRRWPQQFREACEIVPADWPYDCQAKQDNPRHAVYRCASHGVWWHSAR